MADRSSQAVVDASVFLRFFTQDDPAKADRCRALLERATTGDIELHAGHVLLAELAWTLRSPYGIPRASIAERLSDLVAMRSMKIPDRAVIADAVELYRRHNVGFTDAYHVAEMKQRG